jgi:hypothetical protein
MAEGTGPGSNLRWWRLGATNLILWRKQYGGMGVDQLKELKRLQKENEALSDTGHPHPKPTSRWIRGPSCTNI